MRQVLLDRSLCRYILPEVTGLLAMNRRKNLHTHRLSSLSARCAFVFKYEKDGDDDKEREGKTDSSRMIDDEYL